MRIIVPSTGEPAKFHEIGRTEESGTVTYHRNDPKMLMTYTRCNMAKTQKRYEEHAWLHFHCFARAVRAVESVVRLSSVAK